MKTNLGIIAVLALVVCATIPTAALAASTSRSEIRQYQIGARYAPDVIVGKLTVNHKNGHYALDANWGKATTTPDGTLSKDYIQGIAPHAGTINAKSGAENSIEFGSIVYTKGGTAHGVGTLDRATLDWLKTYGDGATFITYRVYK